MNKKLFVSTLSAALCLVGAASAQTSRTIVERPSVEVGVTGGFSGGLGAEGFVHVPDVAGPVGIKGSASFSGLNNAINRDVYDEYNGFSKGMDLETSGRATVLGLDGTYSLGELTPRLEATAYAGGRYGMFEGDIASDAGPSIYSNNAFGVGAGVMVSYPVNPTTAIVGDVGIDNFFDSDITFSNGSESETHEKGSAEHKEIDNFYNQPGTIFKARVGVKFNL